MLVKSDSLQCRVVLTHEEVEALARYLKARLVGGPMVAADEAVVGDFVANLIEHDEKIRERVAAIGNVEQAIIPRIIQQAIQRLDVNEFAQVRDMFESEPTAADFVDSASLVNINEVAARLKAVGHNIVIDEQHGIYQVSRD